MRSGQKDRLRHVRISITISQYRRPCRGTCGVIPGLDVHDDERLRELGLLGTTLLGRCNDGVLLLLGLLLLLLNRQYELSRLTPLHLGSMCMQMHATFCNASLLLLVMLPLLLVRESRLVSLFEPISELLAQIPTQLLAQSPSASFTQNSG